MTASEDDEIVFVGETRAAGGAGEGEARGVKRGRYDGTMDTLAYQALDAQDAKTNANETEAPHPPATATPNTTRDPPLFRLFRAEHISNSHNDGCVTVSDLVRGPVKWGVVSNFKIDLDFISHAAPELLTIPRIHWLHGQPDVPEWTKENLPNKIEDKTWTFLKPQVPNYGTHHSKFFLLVYPAGVRVVVSTANLCRMDLTVMSNAVWWQDFPLKSEQQVQNHASSEFEEDLLDVPFTYEFDYDFELLHLYVDGVVVLAVEEVDGVLEDLGALLNDQVDVAEGHVLSLGLRVEQGYEGRRQL